MTIPKHDELRLPILRHLQQQDRAITRKDLIQPLAKHFKLSEDEITQLYPSGNGEIFKDRISWGLSYLNMSGLVERPKKGVYKISEKGLELLLNKPDSIHRYIGQKMLERRSNSQAIEANTTNLAEQTKQTPSETLAQSFAEIQSTVYDEILITILSKKPYEFERLVIQLLQKMGYGGEIKNAGTVTPINNDGGIDGIIKEDILGLGRIYIQAKRYGLEKSISRPDIQKFVGALAVAQSNKGIFITTCRYSNEATQYANSLNGSANLVLIDGIQLAEYIYHYGLGMQVEQTLEIKKLDTDFWDMMTDDNEK